MISTDDLDATVAECDLAAFRAFVADVLREAGGYQSADVEAMRAFAASPSRDTLRRLIVNAPPLFTMARGCSVANVRSRG